jgi:putative ABC transport system permease protein
VCDYEGWRADPRVSPETVFETVALRGGYRRSIKLVGVDHTYFEDTDFKLAEGAVFTDQQLATSAPVAIIGHDVKVRFFPGVEPLGRQIKCGQMWLTVVGVLQERNVSSQHMERLGIRNYDLDIYTPINTMLLRYENRGQMTANELEQANNNARRGIPGNENYHQLDRLVVRVASSEYVTPVAETVSRMLERRHYGVVDYEVIVPEVLLEQEQQTQNIFNIVLAAIASISLVVGGIGIMNIMLASVMERIREIGVRRAIGATRQDVILQFLIEAMTISFTGGVLGILLGIGLSIGIEHSTGIATYVSIESVLLAFLVSFCVGLVFGLLPAKRAAEQDPVTSLRYE